MPGKKRVERRDRYADGSGPRLPLPTRSAVSGLAECLRSRRHRRIVDVELELEHSGPAADGDGLDCERAIAAIKELQRPDQRRLRLDRYHARAEPAKDGDTVADMCADIEHEVAGVHETAIEPIHGRATFAVAVIQAERAHDASNRPPGIVPGPWPSLVPSLQHEGYRPRCDSSIAGRFRASNSGGGKVSSGRRSRPIAISARPSAGAAVATASGIESSGPPASKKA